MDSGEPERVIELRQDFQRMMVTWYRDVIEELTGRKVVAFLSQATSSRYHDGDLLHGRGPL
jgi:hypothetical protein